MHPSDLRQYIQAVDIQEPYETLWNSDKILNRINDLLDPLKFSGPHHSEWESLPCMDWFRIVKDDPLTKVWVSLCKREFNVDVWVCVTVGSDDVSIFEYVDDPPATIPAVMFSTEQAVEIAKQKLTALQSLTAPVKKE